MGKISIVLLVLGVVAFFWLYVMNITNIVCFLLFVMNSSTFTLRDLAVVGILFGILLYVWKSIIIYSYHEGY